MSDDPLEFMHMRWFGESWGAPVCDPAYRVPAPAGKTCIGCKERIAACDRGIATYGGLLPPDDPHVYIATEYGSDGEIIYQHEDGRPGGIPLAPYHVDCFLFGVLGRRQDVARVGPITLRTGRIPA